MIGYRQISMRQFYDRGGLSNPRLRRRQCGGSWTYWMRTQ